MALKDTREISFRGRLANARDIIDTAKAQLTSAQSALQRLDASDATLAIERAVQQAEQARNALIPGYHAKPGSLLDEANQAELHENNEVIIRWVAGVGLATLVMLILVWLFNMPGV